MESFVSGGGANRSALTASAAIRSQAIQSDMPVQWLNVAGSLAATPLEVARRIASPPSLGETIKCDASGLTYTFGARLDDGEGFFGVVYSATDDFGNSLAVKVLKPKGSYEEDRRAAIREFENLRAFRHPTIIHVYEAFERNGLFYIVMERCWRPLTTLFAPGYSSKIGCRVWLVAHFKLWTSFIVTATFTKICISAMFLCTGRATSSCHLRLEVQHLKLETSALPSLWLR